MIPQETGHIFINLFPTDPDRKATTHKWYL